MIQGGPGVRPNLLQVLANPLGQEILLALEHDSLSLGDLQERTAGPPQARLRAALASLRAAGVVERFEVSRAPLECAYRLTAAGPDALFVAAVLHNWLAECPDGRVPLGSEAAKKVMELALAVWCPRRRNAPVDAAQFWGPGVPVKTTTTGIPDWVALALRPLCIAAHWERVHFTPESVAPISAHALETTFMLAVPLIELPPGTQGACTLAVPADLGRGMGAANLAGVTVEVEDGRITLCQVFLDEDTPNWALGNSVAWLEAVIVARYDYLHMDGADPALPAALVRALHEALFGGPQNP